jgi:hypothetical protein
MDARQQKAVMDTSTLGRYIVLFGLVVIVLGAVVWAVGRLGMPLGRLPGDITLQRGGNTIMISCGTSILLSIVLTVVLNVVLRFLTRR